MDDLTESRIIEAVAERSEEIVAFLQQLVCCESVTGNESKIQEFIAETLGGMGLTVDCFDTEPVALRGYPGYLEPDLPMEGRPNVVGVWRGTGGGLSLLFNGHVDTVPLGPADQWIDGPLSAVAREGAVWGRGASDMKSGLAAMTMAVAVLQGLELRPKGDVILEYTVDEERTGLGTLMCVHRGYRADAGISCETSDLEVMPACIGRMWFTIRVEGRAAGISSHWEGVNPIEKAARLVQAVSDLEQMRFADLHHRLYPDNRGALPCTVTVFQAGTHPSSPPGLALLRGSLGLMPYEDPQEAEQQLAGQIERVAKADPWLRDHMPVVTTEGGYVAAGAEIPASHPLVGTLCSAFERVAGKSAVISGRKGAADTRFLIRQGDTPSVIFGPGPTPQMHAINEHVPIDSLITATQVLSLAIHRWCNQTRG